MFRNPHKIFLLDGVGAFFSAILTGLILPLFSDVLGLPRPLLYVLAIFPIILMLASLSCYFFIRRAWQSKLKMIIYGNLTYCLISGCLIVFYKPITVIGSYLLGAEILVVLLVVALEWKIYKSKVLPD